MMPSNPRSRSHRRAALRILRPLTLTIAIALAACSGTNPERAGGRNSGAPPTALTPDENSATLLKVADGTRNGGDLATSVSIYRRMHENSPGDPVPLARLGETLAALQAYTEAAAAYKAGVALAPNDPDMHRGYGNVLLALGKPQFALAQLEIAAAERPADARTFNAIGVAHDMSGEHDLAQQAYRKGLSLDPDHLGLRNNLGLSQALAGDYPGATATLSDLVARPGATVRYRQNLALVYGLAGDNDHATSVARADLDEAAIRNNLAYYTLLRSLDDVGRTAAILGADVRASKAPPPTATVPAPQVGEAAAVAPPLVGVDSQPLPAAVASAPARASAPKTSAHATHHAAAPAPTPVAEVAAAPAPSPAPVESEPMPAAAQIADAVPAPQIPEPQPSAPQALRVEPSDGSPLGIETASSAPDAVPAPRKAATSPRSIVPSPDATAPKTAAAGARIAIVVQVGSFEAEANAHKLSEKLAAKGYNLVVIHEHDRRGKEWYVVRSNNFEHQEAAELMAQELRNIGELGAMVVHVPSSGAVSAQAKAD
jgi:Flp pilus assembly protein TadD